MKAHTLARRFGRVGTLTVGLIALILICQVAAKHLRSAPGSVADQAPLGAANRSRIKTVLTSTRGEALKFEPRKPVDTSGFDLINSLVKPWDPNASLEEVKSAWLNVARRTIESIDHWSGGGSVSDEDLLLAFLHKAELFNSEGKPAEAYQALAAARGLAERDDRLATRWLYTLIYYQGVSALRRGETENCIMCRGESSCILPISESARHTKPDGSRLAIKHFTEYLNRFSDDLEIRWLLNLAHMTLGEYPDQVDARFLFPLDRFTNSEFDIGRFRDIAHLAGVNRFNFSGGAIMEDFDNDGLLDLVTTSVSSAESMCFYRNKGDGTFEDRSEAAGVTNQLGGLYCVQTDYNNDGFMDIFVSRGAWLLTAVRPTLLKNNGDGTFADVTKEAGLLHAVNSNSASWADYDNDGWLDLFVCCERQPNRLYHNNRDGTFEEVGDKAGLTVDYDRFCKGSAWLDFDNDGDPDLFLNYLSGSAKFFRNNGDGRFTQVTLGIHGPRSGFSCWAWDYDNDGWLDIFATSFDGRLEGALTSLLGKPHGRNSSKLFHNMKGESFVDVTKEAGLDDVYLTMGSNYADFDNDGYLDMYLATGDPHISTLVPNRMLKNVAGARFADITASSGTGHLQKGHAVACGDWDRDGDTDLFVELGGAVKGDMFHNVLFANPGQGNHWLTLKLVGKQTNRAAIGARIKVVTAGESPLTVQRHVSSGSSFGANTLEQTIGLARNTEVALLEIMWPTSGTTQVFRNIPADQAIEIKEFDNEYRKLSRTPLPAPE